MKNNIFNFNQKTLKQKRGTATGTKFVPTYSILFLAELEEKSLEKVDNKPYLWWRYRDDIFFIWEHGEEKLRNFLETLNEFHPTIKFTAEWSQKSINFLDVTVSLINGQIETDLFVKFTDSHQYLHSSSCHPYHCKKSILYNQALRLDQICSKNNFFDIHCNNLEKWLSERGYSEKLVCKETLKARSQSRETLLDKEKMSRNDSRVTFNITYYSVFKNIRNVLEELHILLAPDEQHKKILTDIPRIGFKYGKSLQDHLVRSVLPKIDVAGHSGPCSGKRPPCKLCKLMKKTSTFKKRNSDEIYHIHKPLNCNSKNTVYLIECNHCWKQYTGSYKTKFRYKANNYKSTHRKFKNKK